MRPSVIILHFVPTRGLITGQPITKTELQLDYFRFFSSHIYVLISLFRNTLSPRVLIGLFSGESLLGLVEEKLVVLVVMGLRVGAG